MARSPRKSSIFWTCGPILSSSTRAAGFLVVVGARSGAISVLAMVGLVLGLGEHAELHHPAPGQPFLGALGVVASPGGAACAAIDGAVAGGTQAVRALRGLGLLAGLDAVLDLHHRGDERLRRRRAARDVHVHGDDLVDAL